MNRACDEFFAGPGLSVNQDRRARFCNCLNLPQNVPERLTLADDVLKITITLNRFFEVELLFFQFVLERINLVKCKRILHRKRDLICDLDEQLNVIRSEGVFLESTDA